MLLAARDEAPEIGRSAGCVAGKVLARPVVGIGRLGKRVQVKQVKVQLEQVKVQPGQRAQGVELLGDLFSEPESRPVSTECRNKPREALITRFCLMLRFSGRYRWKRPVRLGAPDLHMQSHRVALLNGINSVTSPAEHSFLLCFFFWSSVLKKVHFEFFSFSLNSVSEQFGFQVMYLQFC